MKISVLFFGITTDLIGASQLELELNEKVSIADFKSILVQKYPKLENINSYAIAVNEEYAEDSVALNEGDVIAVIPPVSGG